jgi:hypothetical protein
MRGRAVDLVIKIAAYCALGLVLLIANIWFVRSVRSAFRRQAMPTVIAPLEIVGDKDEGGARGRGLARMLHGQLRHTEVEIASSLQALRGGAAAAEEARGSGDDDRPQPAVLALRENVPAVQKVDFQVQDPPSQLDVSVGGVEVGGIIAWLQKDGPRRAPRRGRSSRRRRVLRHSRLRGGVEG